MSRPLNPNRSAIHVLESAFAVASGHGEYGLANHISIFTARLRAEGLARVEAEMAARKTPTPEPMEAS